MEIWSAGTWSETWSASGAGTWTETWSASGAGTWTEIWSASGEGSGAWSESAIGTWSESRTDAGGASGTWSEIWNASGGGTWDRGTKQWLLEVRPTQPLIPSTPKFKKYILKKPSLTRNDYKSHLTSESSKSFLPCSNCNENAKNQCSVAAHVTFLMKRGTTGVARASTGRTEKPHIGIKVQDNLHVVTNHELSEDRVRQASLFCYSTFHQEGHILFWQNTLSGSWNGSEISIGQMGCPVETNQQGWVWVATSETLEKRACNPLTDGATRYMVMQPSKWHGTRHFTLRHEWRQDKSRYRFALAFSRYTEKMLNTNFHEFNFHDFHSTFMYEWACSSS